MEELPLEYRGAAQYFLNFEQKSGYGKDGGKPAYSEVQETNMPLIYFAKDGKTTVGVYVSVNEESAEFIEPPENVMAEAFNKTDGFENIVRTELLAMFSYDNGQHCSMKLISPAIVSIKRDEQGLYLTDERQAELAAEKGNVR
jgi:hypothetical protein